MANKDKIYFLQHTFPLLLKKLDGSEKPLWGKMDAQQMVEHMTDSIRIADEKTIHEKIHTPLEKLDAFKNFLNSEKEFRPETKNILLGETPAAKRHPDLATAILELENEIKYFSSFFENDAEKLTINPVFGKLSYSEWVQLLHKHATHHLKQFGLL